MKKIIRIKQPNDAPFNLTWLMNNICPNSCSYCPSTLHNGKNHHYEWENAKRFLNLLFDRYPLIHCSISGGEPSVSPFFRDIVKIFHENGHTVGITSNANKSVDFWSKISKQLNYICFSYHPEFEDKDFIEKIKVSSSNTFVTVRVMMISTRWEQCLNTFHKLSSIKNINIEPVKVVQWEGSLTNSWIYTDIQNQWFFENPSIQRNLTNFSRKIKVPELNATYIFDDGSCDTNPNAVEYVNQGLTNFQGYTCEMGLKELFVHWSGDIYRGNCLDGGIIGNINDPTNIQWPALPFTCTKNLCYCSSDININKWI